MNIERFKEIIEYSDAHRNEIEEKVKKFYSFVGMSSDKEVLNMMQIARTSLKKRGYILLEIPFADYEIGALCYKGDALGYIVLNSSLPKVNINFALCHELYHVFYPEHEVKTKVEFSNDFYYEHESEPAANLFAGILLMPETSFKSMYHRFKEESDDNMRDTIVRLMNYYQVPYMAALIRCYELRVVEDDEISEELLNVDLDYIKDRFDDLWLGAGILYATKKDDFVPIETLVRRFGTEYVKESYLNSRTLEKVLQNMKTLYKDIKGE